MSAFQDLHSQAVVIHKRDAVVWSQQQVVYGGMDTSVTSQGELSVNGTFIPFMVVAGTDSFSVELNIGNGATTIVAKVDSLGTPVYSDTLRLTLGYRVRPEIELTASVTRTTVNLSVQVLDNPEQTPLTLIWTQDAENPISFPDFTGAGPEMTVEFPSDAPEGEYYFNVMTVAGEDTVRARTFVTKSEDGIHPFNIRTDHARWIDEALIYQVTPYNFVANGKFQHITAKIPELRDLGVTTIYLQPVYATHGRGQGYDVTNYFALRTDIGSESDLRTLIQTANALGMKVLFDFIPNHTSIRHPYAQDAILHGPRSHYYDFYQREYDNVAYSMHYHTREEGAMKFVYYFWNDLPNLNYDNPEVRRMVTEAGKYWIEQFDIDGYRIDAVWGLNARRPEFMKEWRLALKRIKPEILLLGEDKATWESSFDERFDVAYDWAPSEAWVSQWVWQSHYDPNSNPTIFNSTLGSQRASRLRAALTNSGNGLHPRAKILRFMENNDTYRFRATHDDARTRMVAAMMFSLHGVPMLYNGQEVAANTPHPYSTYQIFSASTPIWQQDPGYFFPYYRHLARLRARFASLRSDNFEELVSIPSASSYGYWRWEGKENIVVLVNMGVGSTTGRLYLPVDRLALDSTKTYYLTDLVTNEAYTVTPAEMAQFNFPINGYSTRMFILTDSAIVTSVPLADGISIPGEFELSQNFPNPFNPATTITFELPEAGRVVLKVFDVLGRDVATLVDEHRAAGSHRLHFDGTGLTSGLYFYRLQWADRTEVRRMLLMK
jgi:glycosidase